MSTYKNNTIIATSNNQIKFNNKLVRVIENGKYTYKLNKTSISAQGGAYGLVKFMNECINDNFGLVWVDAIIAHMEKISY